METILVTNPCKIQSSIHSKNNLRKNELHCHTGVKAKSKPKSKVSNNSTQKRIPLKIHEHHQQSCFSEGQGHATTIGRVITFQGFAKCVRECKTIKDQSAMITRPIAKSLGNQCKIYVKRCEVTDTGTSPKHPPTKEPTTIISQ